MFRYNTRCTRNATTLQHSKYCISPLGGSSAWINNLCMLWEEELFICWYTRARYFSYFFLGTLTRLNKEDKYCKISNWMASGRLIFRSSVLLVQKWLVNYFLFFFLKSKCDADNVVGVKQALIGKQPSDGSTIHS